MKKKDEDVVYKVEIVNENGPNETSDHPLQKYWRPAAAIVYLVICLFDFIIAPAWVGMTEESLVDRINAIKHLDPNVQMIFAAKESKWEPLTLMGNGMFHLAFGAILTGAAVTRGFEKTEREKTKKETAKERLARMRARKNQQEEQSEYDDDALNQGIGVGDGDEE